MSRATTIGRAFVTSGPSACLGEVADGRASSARPIASGRKISAVFLAAKARAKARPALRDRRLAASQRPHNPKAVIRGSMNTVMEKRMAKGERAKAHAAIWAVGRSYRRRVSAKSKATLMRLAKKLGRRAASSLPPNTTRLSPLTYMDRGGLAPDHPDKRGSRPDAISRANEADSASSGGNRVSRGGGGG